MAAVIVAMVFGIFEVTTGRWQLRPVDSGSMRPLLPVGSVAFVEREPTSELSVGQIVLTHPPIDPKATVIHRVISMTPSPRGVIVQTKGDANPVIDAWQVHVLSAHVYRERFEVPVLGRIAYYVHSRQGREALLYLAAFLLLLAAGNFIYNCRRKVGQGSSASAGRLSFSRDPRKVLMNPVAAREVGSPTPQMSHAWD
jgi:signal peptidase I